MKIAVVIKILRTRQISLVGTPRCGVRGQRSALSLPFALNIIVDLFFEDFER